MAKSFYDKDLIKSFPLSLPTEYYAAHFPLFPGLIRAFSFFLGYPYATLLATMLSAILATYFFYKLSLLFCDNKKAVRNAWNEDCIPAKMREVCLDDEDQLHGIYAKVNKLGKGVCLEIEPRVIDVDGVTKSVATGVTSTVNGIEVYLDSVVAKTNVGDSSAILVLGTQARETYADGDEFIGEDEDNPNWVWDLAKLEQDGVSDTGGNCDTNDATTNQGIRVENDFEMNDLGDNPTGIGQCIDLPNKYLSLCFDSLSVPDTDFQDYTMDFGLNEDLSDANCAAGSGATSTADTVRVWTDVSEGLDLRAFAYSADVELANVTTNVKTKEMWLLPSPIACNGTTGGVSGNSTAPWLNVFYKSTDSPQKVKWFGAVSMYGTTAGSGGTALARVNYGNTKDSNMKLFLTNVIGRGTAGIAEDLNLTWVVTADTTTDMNGGSATAGEEIRTSWGLSSGNLTALGETSSGDAEAMEVKWVPEGRFSAAFLGTKDEDHRTAYGIVIRNPDSNSGSDKVVLNVPSDQVFANIVVKGASAKVTSGSTSYVPTKVSPVSMAASAVSTPTSYNLIVVGGPCANPLAESLFSKTCDGWDLKEGEALVKLVENGEKVAMLVAGTTATDTQRAGKAVAASEKYAFAGTEVLVKGTTMADITVEAPSVAAPAAAEEATA